MMIHPWEAASFHLFEDMFCVVYRCGVAINGELSLMCMLTIAVTNLPQWINNGLSE
jgi:hypothetical protein